MALRAVILDMGGTLIDYPVSLPQAGAFFETHLDKTGLSLEALRDMVNHYAISRKRGLDTLKEATFVDALRHSADINDLKLARWERMEILNRLFEIAFRNVSSLIPGAKELLSYVKSRGIPIGLISNTAWPGKFHEQDLRRFGILDYFDIKIWSSDEGIRKPHKALFLKALGSLGADSLEAVYIGDTYSRDVEGPNSVGIPAIWITNEQPKDIFVGWRAKDLFEVKDILSKIE
ncbi:MAG: HAD family hydrolase [bacterium]|nr:HAD family hydrolase [bacterium]